MDITGVWEGSLDGTNWGRLLAKLSERNRVLVGEAEITDVGLGAFLLDVAGRRGADAVTLELTPSGRGVRAYPGTIDAVIDSETDTLIRGRWRSSIGTHGTFRAERRSEPELSVETATKRIAEANAAFIIMAFAEGQSTAYLPLVDIHAAIKRGCDAVGIKAHRADEVEHSGSITRLILEEIQKASVSDQRPHA